MNSRIQTSYRCHANRGLSTYPMSDMQSSGCLSSVSLAIFKGPSEGFCCSRCGRGKDHKQRLGADLCVFSHRRGSFLVYLILVQGTIQHCRFDQGSIHFLLLVLLDILWRFTAGCPYLCSQSTLVAEHRAPWDFCVA